MIVIHRPMTLRRQSTRLVAATPFRRGAAAQYSVRSHRSHIGQTVLATGTFRDAPEREIHRKNSSNIVENIMRFEIYR